MKKIFIPGLALSGCIALAFASPAAPGGGAAASSHTAWRSSPIWDDGKAEFCAYEIRWRRYGRLNRGRALMILVKEPWAPDLEVKADRPRDDGFDVLKLNHVRDVPTGIYTYHQMASVFLRRDTGALQKLAVTSSEGCGISTAWMVGGRLNTRSYFDGQGERTTLYPSSAVPEDGLAAALRDHVEGDLPQTIEVFPSLMTGRFPPLEARRYSIIRSAARDLEVPAGRFRVVTLRLERADRWLEFAFHSDPPHPLIQLRQSDGTIYRLAKCERIAYWKMNGEGGEEWLPMGVR